MNNPESAFPSTFRSLHPEEAQVHRWGMTLRDYFAAKAMQGILTDPEIVMGATEIANLSYKYADAMLKAREQ